VRRVAIFGNAGGGKSTLARRLAATTGLPLHAVDRMRFRDGGGPVPEAEYLSRHAELLRGEAWIIEGFGSVETAFARFDRADTLIHVDLPLILHRWWVTKRLIKGLFVQPEGWPARSPIWRSSLSSYRVIGPCDRHLTPRYRRVIQEMAGTKRVHSLTSPAAIRRFIDAVAQEHRRV
jgi:adenylate kinase family enzyme